jgi:hypothetical protein
MLGKAAQAAATKVPCGTPAAIVNSAEGPSDFRHASNDLRRYLAFAAAYRQRTI